MNPEITVLMSVYNDEKYLRECLDSILNQSYSNFEFLIIDDASTDGSYKILKEYAAIDKRINLIQNKINKGLSYNLAEGVLKARTPWIARMDADDVAFENRLEKQLAYIKENSSVDILGSLAIDIDDNINELGLRKVPSDHKTITKLIWTCPLIHPTVMFKRTSILTIGSYNRNLKRRQDYELWFRAVRGKLIINNINEPLLYYRFTPNHYEKNDFSVQLQQFKIGFKGLKAMKSNFFPYLGIALVFLKNIMPQRIRKTMNGIFILFDPRKN